MNRGKATDGTDQIDPYSRVDYRRLIAWPVRIQRESVLLKRVLGDGPRQRVLDLGCGTGEHSRFLNSQGFDVLGIDRSESMIAKALDSPLPEGLRFQLLDLTEIAEGIQGEFSGAICLGNTLPHIRELESLRRFLRGLRSLLLPGAPFLLQILNYGRIVALGERHLPLNFRPDEDGELVFLRLMEVKDQGEVLFFPTTLRFRPDADPPVEVVRSQRVELYGWRVEEMRKELQRAGFSDLQVFGDIEGGSFLEEESRDLILVAR